MGLRAKVKDGQSVCAVRTVIRFSAFAGSTFDNVTLML